MAKASVSVAMVNRVVRDKVAEQAGLASVPNLVRLSNQSFYTIVTDENGAERLVELRIVVSNVDETETAQEKLDGLIEEKRLKDEKAEQIRKAKEEKAKRDAERRKKKEKNEDGEV